MNDESWDGGIGVLRAKVQGGAATWDVVQVESDELAVGCEEGLFEKIEYSKIGGEAAYLPPTVNSCGVGAPRVRFSFSATTRTKLKDGAEELGRLLRHQEVSGQAQACARVEDPAVELERPSIHAEFFFVLVRGGRCGRCRPKSSPLRRTRSSCGGWAPPSTRQCRS